MGLFDKRQRQPDPDPEPPKVTMVYAEVEADELKQRKEDCDRAGLEYRVEDQGNGIFRMLFYKEDQAEAQRILSLPRRAPEPKKAAIDSQIGSAYNRTQIPDNALTRATAAAEQQRASVRAQLQKPSQPPTEIENRWAIEKSIEELTEQVKEAETEIQEADAMLAANAATTEPAPEDTGKQKKKRKSLGRTNQIKTRLTDAELVQFQRRVKKSGLSQGDYLRSAALTGEIRIEERSMADIALLDELALIRAELGRQGGLLKMVIKPNQGQRTLAPEEWSELIQTVRGMEKMRDRIAELEVKVQHGDTETQGKQKSKVR